MTNFATKIGQLYMENEDNARSFLGMYIADPTPLEEKNLGRVYTLIEISNDLDEANEVIDIINQSISNAYYQSTSFEIEIALETALKSLNKKLQQITSELGEDWLDKISAIIAVQKGQEIHFAQIGTIHSFLVQDKKIIEIGGANKEKINPLKIFSNILSGNLTKKSTLIFCTESILDYVSQEKLRKTVTENDPKDAATYLQNLLSESSNQTNFGALFLKVTEQTAGEAAGVKTDAVTFESNGDEDSMENLVSKEKNTSELLAPSIWPGIKKNIQKIKRPKNQEFSEESIETHEESEEELPVPSKIKETRKKETKTLEIFQKIGKVLKNIGIQIINGVAALGRGITGLFKKRKEYPQKMKSLPQKTTGWFSKIVDWFKELSTPRKVLLILVIVIVFVLAQSLMRTELN
ncbi:hypothetical protein KKF29_00870, partial [Patescibacteria group bacterium]|nr:hypothetical protein [Patescibacteria group bacterium]